MFIIYNYIILYYIIWQEEAEDNALISYITSSTDSKIFNH
jgi:hypothetical protein